MPGSPHLRSQLIGIGHQDVRVGDSQSLHLAIECRYGLERGHGDTELSPDLAKELALRPKRDPPLPMGDPLRQLEQIDNANE